MSEKYLKCPILDIKYLYDSMDRNGRGVFITMLSQGSKNYLDSLAAKIGHNNCSDYEQALKELTFFVEYLGPKGFDMMQYQKILGRVCSV